MCGDSTNGEDVDTLMGDVKADMIYCDPPYNIGLDYSKGLGLYKKKGEERQFNDYGGNFSKTKDAKTDDAYINFVDATLTNALAHSKKDAHVFYWCDQNWIWVIQMLYRKQGLSLKRVALWVKNNMNLRPQTAFNKLYEPVVYATKGKPFLNRTETKQHEILNREVRTGNQVYEDIGDIIDMWLVKRDVDYEHPTQKPTTLHEKPLRRCTAPGHIILDLFGGSGSTLIACEDMKRKAYLMEQDPIFVQVIINRYEKYTDKKAKKI
jgi:site-specific DNA-methyltransferase (adenine-specific)